MPLYAVIGFDHPSDGMPVREQCRAEHRAFALENDRDTRLAGAMFDAQGNQCGTLIICEAAGSCTAGNRSTGTMFTRSSTSLNGIWR